MTRENYAERNANIRDPVRFEEIPPEQLQALCGAVIEITREQFRRPEIQEEFARWKAERKRTALHSLEKTEAPN